MLNICDAQWYIWYVWCFGPQPLGKISCLYTCTGHMYCRLYNIHIIYTYCTWCTLCNRLYADCCWTQLCNMQSRDLCVWEMVLLSHEARHHRRVALTPGQRTEMDGGADWGENDLKISRPAIVTISGPCKKEAGISLKCVLVLRYANGDQREGFFTDSSLEGQVQKLRCI